MTGRNSATIKRGREEKNSPEAQQRSKQRATLDYWLGIPPPVSTSNRFDALAVAGGSTDNSNSNGGKPQDKVQSEPKPPPIYVHGVEQINPLRELLDKCAPNGYALKVNKGNEVRIQVNTSEHYRVILKELQDKGTDLHSYQFKNERSFRVVLRGLHQSTATDEIKEELEKMGHTVKNISNIRDRITKAPMPMFYVDLKQNPNNREIYDINRFMHSVVVIEPPRKKREIPQCERCQRYGHTQSFCSRPYRCVKCDSPHSSKECLRRIRDEHVVCTNCGLNHPSNYRGCRVHKELQQKLFPKLRERAFARERGNSARRNETHSYADVMRNQNNTDENSVPQISHAPPAAEQTRSTDMDDLKSMMKMLMENMSTMMKLLTTLVTQKSSQNSI